MPWKKGDLEIIYNKLGSNATNEEILQYVATHPKSNPGTMFITPYSTNGYG
jgi:Ca2+-binding EF-hand superfamily protein